jgi:hypothetical protein
MTHDELKVLIETKFNNHTALHDAQIVNALYRVVELHNPEEYGGPARCPVDGSHYPCSTIEAINKELI